MLQYAVAVIVTVQMLVAQTWHICSYEDSMYRWVEHTSNQLSDVSSKHQLSRIDLNVQTAIPLDLYQHFACCGCHCMQVTKLLLAQYSSALQYITQQLPMKAVLYAWLVGNRQPRIQLQPLVVWCMKKQQVWCRLRSGSCSNWYMHGDILGTIQLSWCVLETYAR
jgi:hypothetical protein